MGQEMKRFSLVLILLSTLFSQGTIDEQVVARIKIEAFQNSRIMTTLSRITDVYGGRLTGSPTYLEAANWCVNQMGEWNIKAQLEPWGVVENGWTFDDVAVKVTSPYYFPIIAYPKAWTSGTAGPITGQPVLIDIQDSKDIEQYRGQLKGKIVFNGKPGSANPHFTADAQRMQADEQGELKALMTPDEYYVPGASWERYSKWLTTTDTITQFFAEESIAVLIEPSERDHGVVRLTRQTNDPNYVNAFPAIVIAREQYGRIYRLIENEFPVELNINIKTTDYADVQGYNVIAEIPGTDRKLKNEVVMLGAHLDSWHAGTGATDDGGNCAILMEAMRIIKALDLKTKRTIRLALWEGEEQGYFGSLNYVRHHFGNPEDMQLLPEHEKLSVYFNLDEGCGKIRGVYLQSNEMARTFFETCFAPFEYLGVNTISVENVSYTDHMPFNWVGLPGFHLMQDPIEYRTRTHHTNMDVYEAVLEEDVKLSAAVVATLIYQAANRLEMIPRLKLPEPEK